MSGKKILVCGATGFVGRNTAEYLKRRNDFEIFGTYLNSPPLQDSKISMIKADLTRKEEVEKAIEGMDVIVQAAAACSGVLENQQKPYIHVTDNVVMNPFIFQAAHEQEIPHLIFPSCTTMYHSSDELIREEDVDLGRGIPEQYFACGWTKLYIEKMSELFASLGNTKHTVFRHSNAYGPHDKFDLERSHVFGATITKVMTANPGDSISVWGTGEEERDLLYVSDVARFIERAIDRQENPFELVNIGYGSSISIGDLVQKIIGASGKDLRIKYDSTKPTVKTKVALDFSKAEEIFGWRPKTSLEEGIKKTMSWYEANISNN